MRVLALADDLTGAAEIAGCGLRHGLTARLQRERFTASDAELIAVDSDSRALCDAEAASRIGTLLREVGEAEPQLVYKKTDSALRGPIAAELCAAAEALGRRRILFIPQNPSRGRVIRSGRYLIEGVPLDRTGFADDPLHPATTADVLPRLAPCPLPVVLFEPGQAPPQHGLAVGCGSCRADLERLAEHVDERTLPAGGAEFFEALLCRRGLGRKHRSMPPAAQAPALVVCGSACESSRAAVAAAERSGARVCRMPEPLFRGRADPEPYLREWVRSIRSAMAERGQAVVAIDRPPAPDRGLASRLTSHLAELAGRVLGICDVAELFIEGGTTAAAVFRRARWTDLAAEAEWAPGVVRLRAAAGQVVTVKPGSYPWPESIWLPPTSRTTRAAPSAEAHRPDMTTTTEG